MHRPTTPRTAAAPRPVRASRFALLAGLLALAAAPVDDPVEVSIAKLTSVEYKPGDDLPQEITDLDGQEISLEGYMALGTIEGVDHFELVPEPCECGRSKVQHFIDVKIEQGNVSYRPGRITLVGTFDVGEEVEDGFVVSLYRLKIRSLD